MHFRYFTSFSGLVVLPPSAYFCKVCDVSAHHLISGYSLYFLYFFSVEPNARTPYIGCYATQYDPIAIFLSWALLLLYDKGAVVDYYRILNPECAENFCISDVHIDDHCSLESSSLWAFFDADSSLHFSEIIQIARQVEALSWRLYTEMVGPMYLLFSLSSKGLNRGFVLLLSIWCVHISCIFSVLTPSKWYRW